MTKPTEAQRRVLEAMRDGRRVHVYLPIRAEHQRAFFRHLPGEGHRNDLPSVTPRTVRALAKREYVEIVGRKPYSTDVDYAITPSGRAALQQSGVGYNGVKEG